MTDLSTTNVSADNKKQYHREPVVFNAIVTVIIWSLFVGFSLNWNVNNLEQVQINLATDEARANWKKDQSFRSWATKHGGLYVKPDARTPPSPYLSHLPHRDVVTTDGTKLTLMNPAYMMRQMTEEYAEDYGIKGNVTGKILLNPINEPDDWERNALEQFDKGIKEVVELSEIRGEIHLRLMKPMLMKKDCEKCHGHLGFKAGDIRGGVSVSIPLAPYMLRASATSNAMKITHSIVWLVGILAIIAFAISARQRDTERYELQAALAENHQNLNTQFEDKTKELRESKIRFQRIHDFANIGTWSWDLKTGNVNLSEHIAPMFGYELGMLDTRFENFLVSVHPEDLAFVKQALNACLEKKVEYDIEYRVLWPNGEPHWLHAQGEVFRDENDTALNMLGIIHDITTRKQAENDLQNAKTLSDKANQAKTEFLASMSHELRTPLNAVLGFSQVLDCDSEQPLTDSQKTCVHHITEGGEHLLALINEILDLAKIEAGKLDLRLEELSPQKVVSDCLLVVKSLAEEFGVELRNQYSTDENSTIISDHTRIKQILLNLLTNAIKYNNKDGTVTVKGGVLANSLHIEIIDTGPGIPADMQDELFKPFSRLGAEASGITGTGIGLCVSKQLIDLMGGQIGLNSAPGKGSTFWIELPLTNEGVIAPTLEGRQDKPLTPGTFPDINGQLLYIEDNQANQQLMTTLVSKINGLEIIVEENAELGIQKACQLQPDVIILDINLPGMNGFEALAKIKTMPATAHIPVLAMSADASPEQIQRGIEAGFIDYLTKPIQVQETANAIKLAMDISRGHSQQSSLSAS